jgi:hypothetical protein
MNRTHITDHDDLRGVEARLRDAAAAYAATVAPAPDAWARLRGRVDGGAARRSRVRVGGGLLVGAVLAAAAVAGAVTLAGDPDGGLVVETPPGTDAPGPADTGTASGVVYAAGDAIIVLDAAGNEVARGATPQDDATVRHLQASTDGSTLWYLDVPEATAPCGTVKARALPLDGVETDLGIAATAFAVSPDAARIAYATRGSGCDPSSQLSYVVVRDLPGGDASAGDGGGDAGEEHVWAHEPGLDSDDPLLADSLAWSPDGSQLAVGACVPGQGCGVRVLDPSSAGGRLGEAPSVAGGNLPAWVDRVHVATVEGPESYFEGMLADDPSLRDVHRVTVWELRGGDELFPETAIDGLGDPAVVGLAHDPRTGAFLLTFDDGTVARFDGTALAEVTTGATAAAFVTLVSTAEPAPSPTTAPPTTVPPASGLLAPGAVVYASGNRVLTEDGAELAVVPDGVTIRELAVSPAGAVWGLTVPAGDAYVPCGTLVDRLDDPTAATLTIPAGAFALSPDGTRLAYSARGDEGCEMADDGRVVVVDLATGEERVVASHEAADPESLYPLLPGRVAWSAEGERLAIERCWEGCDVVVVPASTEGAALGALPSTVVGAYPAFLPDGRLVVADGFWNREGESSAQTAPSAVFSFVLEMEGDDLVARSGEEIASAGAAPLQGVWVDPATGRILLLIDGTLTLRGAGSIDVDVVAATFVPGAADEPPPGMADCSAAGIAYADAPVAEGPVEQTRYAALEAAVACDWERLRALMADDFSYSFGGNLDADEAIAAWQDAEGSGEPILATLAERLLAAPREAEGYFSFEDPSDPLAYRAVIRADGTWTAFVAGD